MRGVDHLTAKDAAIFMKRDDQRATELAEHSIKVGLLISGMILFSEHEHHRRLIAKGLAPMCRHITQLRVLAVSFENARHRRLHVGGGSRLFGRRATILQHGAAAHRNERPSPMETFPRFHSVGWLCQSPGHPDSFISPVAVPPVRLPKDTSPVAAPQPLNAPAFVNSSLT